MIIRWEWDSELKDFADDLGRQNRDISIGFEVVGDKIRAVWDDKRPTQWVGTEYVSGTLIDIIKRKFPEVFL